MTTPHTGKIGWIDLTVDDADTLRDFYQAVAGWLPQAVEMAGYHDYTMLGPDGEPVAGVCHKRGVNAAVPSQWLIYIRVDDLEASLALCAERGGALLGEVRGEPGNRFAIIQDPAGAVCALYEQHDAPPEA